MPKHLLLKMAFDSGYEAGTEETALLAASHDSKRLAVLGAGLEWTVRAMEAISRPITSDATVIYVS